MISKEKEAEILRLYHAERWSMHTIARQTGVHHSTVKRVLFQAGETKASRRRSALSEPYIPLIVETLGKYPKLTASRLFEMAKARGYSGGPDHFRRVVSCTGRARRQKPIRDCRHYQASKRRLTGPTLAV